MPKIAKELTSIAVKALTKKNGWHFVGGAPGLFLRVNQPAASWILRIRSDGKRVKIGLGSYSSISLAHARKLAQDYRTLRDSGVDPLVAKRKEKLRKFDAVKRRRTFDECVQEYMSLHLAKFSNEKHRKQWVSTFDNYVKPIIGNTLVGDVGKNEVLAVMNQIVRGKQNEILGTFWEARSETAKRVLDRIRRVIDFAIVSEYRKEGHNPAVWRGYLDTQLSARSTATKKHHPALPYQLGRVFLKKLRVHDGISARAIEFLMFVGVRSGSVRKARWKEMDLKKKIWTIPAEHNKVRQIHRVPLSKQAVSLLKSLPRLASSDVVFPSKTGKVLSDMALSEVMRGMLEKNEIKEKAVPHGFRATFRSWAADMTSYPDEVRKAASGHAVSDQVLKAYQRTDFFDKRRQLMQEWADYIDPPKLLRNAKTKTS